MRSEASIGRVVGRSLTRRPVALAQRGRAAPLGSLVLCGLLLGWGSLSGCGGGTALGSTSDGSQLCGNGRLDPQEDCDGERLGGETCAGLGYLGGTLGCTTACSFDTSGCDGPSPVCGDGIVSGMEQCDHPDYGGATCETLGYAGGDLACTTICLYDVSGCQDGSCGDGLVQAGEDCDGADLSGLGCEDLGFEGGVLGCALDCSFDTSQCTGAVICGNGSIDAGEDCDGADLAGQGCEDLGFEGGVLGCALDCSFDTSGCIGGCSPTGGALSCADSITDDTATSAVAVSSIDGYAGPSCATWPMTGPEIVYSFSPAQDEGVQIDLTGLSADLDLIVLEDDGLGCDASLPCLRWGGNGGSQSEQARFTARGGATYYVVVDGFSEAAGPFTLTFSCVEVEICTDGSDNDGDGAVDCADPDCAGDPACFVRQIYELFPTNDPNQQWDLTGTTITFQPSSTAPDGYTFSTQGGVAAYPTAPGSSPSATTVAFAAKDDSVLVPFPAGQTFTFFGVSHGEVWVNSHGNLTFGSGDLQFEESAQALAAGPPRIAADWDHLDVTQGGTVTVDRLSDRFVVTYHQIPDRFYGGVHSFQIQLFGSGTITITNLAHDGVDGLVGISEGGGLDYGPAVDFYQGAAPNPPLGYWEQFVPNQGDPFDLDGQVLTFTPDMANLQGYSFGVAAAPASLRFTPGTGNVSTQVLTLGDDASVEVALTAPHQVWYYGQNFTTVHVGSNGFITFGTGSNDWSPTAAELFAAPPRIAALWADWTPNTGGAVTVDEHSLSGGYVFVVTYEGLPRFNNPGGASTFQIALFTSGLIAIQYADVNTTDGLVGIGNGAGGPPPAETNFLP